MINEIKKMPKVELHLHLDGSLSIGMASRLSGLSFDEVYDKMVVDECNSLKDYLKRFEFPISLMQSSDNLELVSKDLVDRLASQNVIYAEVRFAPMFHTKKGLSYDEIVESVIKGLNSNSMVKINLILCLMRGANQFDNLKTIDTAYKYFGRGVCAIDLAGDEKKYPLEDYYLFFDLAKKRNIPFTVHAGEVLEEEMISALSLDIKRIGHGIKAINNENLLETLKERNILLEVCPTSNIQTKVVDNYLDHPIKKLIENGILVSINTDNPGISNISLTEEYIKLYIIFKFSLNEFINMNINAINGSFLSIEDKRELLKKISK